MDDASDKGLKANEQVVPKSEANKLKAWHRERALGKKTIQVDLLKEVVEIARKMGLTSRWNSSEGEGSRSQLPRPWAFSARISV